MCPLRGCADCKKKGIDKVRIQCVSVPYGGVQIARAAAERYKKSAVDAGYRTQNSGKVRISAYHRLCDENIVQKIVTSAVHAGCE